MCNESLMLDVGQANELKLAMRREGFSNKDLKALCAPGVLKGLLPTLRKQKIPRKQ